jgi:NitT/TauT family transport system substrate-binding protein
LGSSAGGAASPAAAPAAQPAASPAAAAPAAAKPSGPLPKVRMATGAVDFTKVNDYKWVQDMKDQGVADIELVPFENSALMAQATVSGSTQFQSNTLLSVIQLAQQDSQAIKFIAVRLQSPDYILVGRKSLESLKALEGKRLGISTPGDISDTLSRIALKRANVDVDKVQFVRVGGTGARISALQQGSIEAGMAHAADGLIAISKSPDLKDLLTVGEVVQNYIQDGLGVRTDFLANNKELTQKLLDGYIESLRWAAKNKAEYIALGKKELKALADVDDKVLSDSYDIYIESKMFAVNGGVSQDVIKNTISLDQEAGNLKGTVPDASKWLDDSLVNDYLKRKGSF